MSDGNDGEYEEDEEEDGKGEDIEEDKGEKEKKVKDFKDLCEAAGGRLMRKAVQSISAYQAIVAVKVNMAKLERTVEFVTPEALDAGNEEKQGSSSSGLYRSIFTPSS